VEGCIADHRRTSTADLLYVSPLEAANKRVQAVIQGHVCYNGQAHPLKTNQSRGGFGPPSITKYLWRTSHKACPWSKQHLGRFSHFCIRLTRVTNAHYTDTHRPRYVQQAASMHCIQAMRPNNIEAQGSKMVLRHLRRRRRLRLNPELQGDCQPTPVCYLPLLGW